MDRTITAIERAFQLARSGNFASVEIVKQQLKTEGYRVAQITGPTLSKQLLALIRNARSTRGLP